MANEKTSISWTDVTWNPTTGCHELTAGCDRCYARELTKRYGWNGGNFNEIILHPKRLDQPFKWKEPKRIFVNSMSDLFHKDVPDEYIARVFDVMRRTGWHTYQILTKRSARMKRWTDWPDNVQAGTSVEDDRVMARIDHLRQTPAAVRFISAEPLLGPLPGLNLDGIHWLIAGGESGPGCRRLDLDWVRDLRDQCVATGVAFHFKQVGGLTPKSNGRLLDGRVWNEFPEAAVVH